MQKTGYFVNPGPIGHYSVTGLGFKPGSIQFFISKNDGMNTWFCEGHGFVDDQGNQNCSAWTGNYSNRFLGDMKTDRCLYAFNATPTVQVNATFVSMDDDGFTLNFVGGSVNTAFSIRWLAISDSLESSIMVVNLSEQSFQTGIQRIFYSTKNSVTGKIVTMKSYCPLLNCLPIDTFTEIDDGLYYLDFNFEKIGSYIATLYEDGVVIGAIVYRCTL